MITAREINITSDCGHYTIKGKLTSLSDCYTQDNWTCMKNYKGSVWSVQIYKDGQPINGIQVMDGNYQPYIHFGEYGCGICQYGVKLSKNTILYAAVATHMFGNALKDENAEKIERKYWKEYANARIKYEQNH